MPGLTTRQRFEAHDMNACTGACHAAMDPIGYGFEHYDGIGAYRTTDQSLPVDSNGSVMLDGKTQTFEDAVGLANLLARARGAGLLRQADGPLRAQPLGHAGRRRVDRDRRRPVPRATGNVRDLIGGVATSRTFRYRTPAPR